MTLTLTATSTTAQAFTRAPEFVVDVVGYKPAAVVKAHCVSCGWYGYETCHHDTVTAHTAHLLSTHTTCVVS
jgi:hypothetical protein